MINLSINKFYSMIILILLSKIKNDIILQFISIHILFIYISVNFKDKRNRWSLYSQSKIILHQLLEENLTNIQIF